MDERAVEVELGVHHQRSVRLAPLRRRFNRRDGLERATCRLDEVSRVAVCHEVDPEGRGEGARRAVGGVHHRGCAQQRFRAIPSENLRTESEKGFAGVRQKTIWEPSAATCCHISVKFCARTES